MQKTFGYQTGKAPGQKTSTPKPATPKPAAPKADTSQVRAMSKPSTPKASGIKSSRLASALGSVGKFKAENYDAIVRYMVGEGYAPNEEAAVAIVEHMSDAWVADLME